MSVPAKRRSSSRQKRGRAHLALAKMRLVACPHCKKPMLPHRACPSCGNYRGRAALVIKTKEKKTKK